MSPAEAASVVRDFAQDPETRDVVETIYIRRVEKVGGKLTNVEFAKIENVKDPVKARMAKKQ